MKLIKNTKRS